MDHEADDFAGREVVPGFFIGLLIESADEFFKDGAHLGIGDPVGVEIDGGEFFDDEKEAVGFLQLGDFLLEAIVLKDFPCLAGEALNIVHEVLGYVVRVADQFLKRKLAGVVESLPGHAIEHGFGVFDLGFFEILIFL